MSYVFCPLFSWNSNLMPNYTYEAQFYDNTDIAYYNDIENINLGYNSVIHRSSDPKHIPFVKSILKIIQHNTTFDTIYQNKPLYSQIFQTYNNATNRNNCWFILKGLTFDGDFDRINPDTLFKIYDIRYPEAPAPAFPYYVPGIDLFEKCILVQLHFADSLNSINNYYTFIENCCFKNNIAAGFESYRNFNDVVYYTNIIDCRKGIVQTSNKNKLKLINCKFGLSKNTFTSQIFQNSYFPHYGTPIFAGFWQEPNANESSMELNV